MPIFGGKSGEKKGGFFRPQPESSKTTIVDGNGIPVMDGNPLPGINPVTGLSAEINPNGIAQIDELGRRKIGPNRFVRRT